MILRAQIFISTVFAQPKFLPVGPLLLILENIYVNELANSYLQ